MCSTGQCGWCECEVDGVPSVRSCRVPVRDGLVARGRACLAVGASATSCRSVGLFSRWIPPTFYHHRFLRPRRLRKRYLDVLRWFGGRGRLTLHGRRAAGHAPRPSRRLEADVLVVGAGASGVAAATKAADSAATVILLDPDGSVPALPGVQVLAGVAAVGWYDGMVAALGDDAAYEITARSVVAATGSYDRVPLVPGADRPGVMAARLVTELVDRHGVLPGRRVLLVGEDDDLATAADRLRRAGASTLHGPIPTASLVSVRGRRRVSGADVMVDGRRRRLSVDLVVFGDRSPNLDLVLAAGAAVERQGDTLVPVLDGDGRTTVPTLSVVGSATGRWAPRTRDTRPRRTPPTPTRWSASARTSASTRSAPSSPPATATPSSSSAGRAR